MTATILLSVLVLIALLAPRYGADSRSLRDAPRYRATPLGDLKAAWWRFRSALERPSRSRATSGTPSGPA